MPDPRRPPTPLERALGQLIEAGVVAPDHLAACLGLESRHVARPLRHLVLAGAVRQEPDGALRLTDSGRDWLAVETLAATIEPAIEGPPATPRLRPLTRDDADAELAQTAADADHERAPWPAPAREPAGTRSPPWGGRFPRSVARARMRVGVGARAVAAITAVTLLVLLLASARAGLAERAVATAGVLTGRRDRPAVAMATLATAPDTVATAAPSPAPVAWVARTGGAGLVLRPGPAASARLRTLPDGTLLRITGDAVQQAGRAWLPVRAPTGEAGWVAADFLDKP